MKWFAVAVLAACGQPPPTTTPSAVVRADVERAETAEQARHHDEARARYEQAIADARDPASAGFAHREYAETLETWGDVGAAIVQLEAAVAAVPDDAIAWHDLGILRHHQANDAGAIVALGRAKQLAPRNYKPRVALAALLWATGDRAAAAVEYRALLELDLPDRLRAKIRWALGQLARPGPGPAPPPTS